MRATPGHVRDFVAQIPQRVGFAVGFRAECGADSGPQVRRYQAFAGERGVQPGDFGDQMREVIDQARDQGAGVLASRDNIG
jgi:hypothetical protein